MRRHPFLHLTALEASQCMRSKTEEGDILSSVWTLQQVTSAQQSISGRRILLSVFFLP